MKNPNIEIKNIKVNLAFSEETTCFTADVFVNGVKTGYAKNDGHGGDTFINAYEGKRDLLNEAEAFARTLPKIDNPYDKNRPFDSTLDFMVDIAVDNHVNAKEKVKYQKKLEKAMVCNIVFGVPNSGNARIIGYGKTPLKAICLTNRVQVQGLIDRIRRDECKNGVEILNTNLAELGLK